MRPRTGNRIADLSFDFSIMILDYCDMLTAQKRYTVANQLSRCATSIGANIAEAQSSESLADFIHKMKIADKEARETEYWLEICEQEIARMLTSIISTAKSKLRNYNKEQHNK